jgi:hypothetical protein
MENNYFIFATCKGGKVFLVGGAEFHDLNGGNEISFLYAVWRVIQGRQVGIDVRLTRVDRWRRSSKLLYNMLIVNILYKNLPVSHARGKQL